MGFLVKLVFLYAKDNILYQKVSHFDKSIDILTIENEKAIMVTSLIFGKFMQDTTVLLWDRRMGLARK